MFFKQKKNRSDPSNRLRHPHYSYCFYRMLNIFLFCKIFINVISDRMLQFQEKIHNRPLVSSVIHNGCLLPLPWSYASAIVKIRAFTQMKP